MKSGPKFKILNKRKGKDINALIHLVTTLQVALNFSKLDITIIN